MDIRIALVEDNPNLRKRFEEYFALYPNITLEASYASAEAALDGIRSMSPSRLPKIVLMDIELPKMTGIEATAVLRSSMPEIEIIMLTVFEDQQRILESIQAGACGYLLKDEPPEVIVDALEDCLNGGAPISQAIARKVLSILRAPMPGPPRQSPAGSSGAEFDLSEREVELLKGLVAGETYVTLAEKLFISPHTVRTHIRNIYQKLHVHSRAQAVRTAMEKRLV